MSTIVLWHGRKWLCDKLSWNGTARLRGSRGWFWASTRDITPLYPAEYAALGG